MTRKNLDEQIEEAEKLHHEISDLHQRARRLDDMAGEQGNKEVADEAMRLHHMLEEAEKLFSAFFAGRKDR